MQKRVKLDHLLRQRHIDYPNAWKKVLQNIVPASPIFRLSNLGSIALIDQTLYFVLNPKYINKWKCVKPMINIFDYFIMPQYWRLNQHQQSFSSLENYAVHLVIDYLTKLIQEAHLSLFLNIIDLSALGKLIISKHYIQYINGQHEWKYQFFVQRVALPRLLVAQNQQTQNNQKMAKKFSVSLNKARSLSNQKQSKKNINLKRASSISNLTQYQSKKMSTQLSHGEGTPLKMQIQRSRFAVKQEKTSLQSKQRSKTQHNLMIIQEKQQEKKEKIAYSSFFKRSNSKQKTSTQQKGRLQTHKQVAKPKLKINRQSFVPPQRKNAPISCVNYQKQLQKQTQNFVFRCTFNVFKLTSLKAYKQSQKHEFIREISQIYDDKFDEVKKRRDDNYQCFCSNKRVRTSKLNLSKRKISHIKLLTTEEHSIFQKNYQIIQDYNKRFTNLTRQYIINFAQHQNLMARFINSLTLSFQSYSLSLSLTIRIGLLLQNFHQHLLEYFQKLLSKIQKEKSKLILVKIISQQNFQLIEKQGLQVFESSFVMFETFLKQKLPKYLHLQPHQLSKIPNLCIKIAGMLQKSKHQYQKNVAFFKTLEIKMLLSGTYKRQKQAIQLIKQLQKLKHNIQNQSIFKSEIIIEGIFLKMGVIKDVFIRTIQQKLRQIFIYFLSYYQKSVAQLSIKLNAIVAINVDYLNDYKCRQYKQSIEENYQTIVTSLMLLIQYLFPLLKELKIEEYLGKVYMFREQIKKNFQFFDQKLQQYRKTSVKTIKILQAENKANKQLYQQLNQRLKKFVSYLSTQKMILQQKSVIEKLQKEFQSYNIVNQKVATSMKENQMIYWQDDTYFINQITLLKKSLNFLEGKHYKNLVNTAINELTIQDFISSFEEFTNFINELSQNKLEKLFRPIYNLIEANLLLIEIFMYNQYQETSLSKLKQLGIFVQNEKQNKILAIIKRCQNIDKKILKKVQEIYRQSRVYQFNQTYERNPLNLALIKEKGLFNISYIANFQELQISLQIMNPVKNRLIIEKLEILQKLYFQVVSFNKMINLISNFSMGSQTKNSITAEINSSYQKLLKMSVQQGNIEIVKRKITQLKAKYMDILFNQKCSIFPRYCLYSISQIIQLSSWGSRKQTEKNIKILYEEIDSVDISQQNIIKSLTIAKDSLLLQRPIDVMYKQGQKSKSVFVSLDGLFRNSLSHSLFASVQMKMLFWHIYFTQQVQLQFFSDGVSIEKLKERLQVVVTQIANQIRYDIKLHHKGYQIAQLNIFISHLDKIRNIGSLSDYQWVSTIRCYDRAKIVKIQQNQGVFQYGFQPKKPQNINPAFQIQTGITYGFKQSSNYYQQSAYILGKPYKTFKVLAQYGFKENYTNLMNIIKKYTYFLKIIVNQINLKKVNYFHKKIFQMTLQKEEILQSQRIKMPIFFQYQNEAVLPSCFPQKIRNFRNPQISYDLNLIIYLELNKMQSQIDKRRIDIDVLHRAISYINKQKSVTLKKVLDFTSKLKQFLKNQQEQQSIYKFCLTYFIVNFQTQNQQLSSTLKCLIRPANDSKIQSIFNYLKQDFYQFMQNETKKHIIFYGQTSLKTQLLKELRIVSFYQRQQTQSTLYHVEGLQQFLDLQKQQSLKKYRFAIQDRSICQIDPSQLGNCKLMYINEFQQASVEQLFKSKITSLKIEGNYLILWKMFTILHFSYVQVCQNISLLGSMELAVRVFSKYISDFINELDKNDKETFQLAINKDLIRSFLIIIHELYYYLTPPGSRKKFTEKIKENSFLDDYKAEDLSSITCKGLTCDKIINFIKKQKQIFSHVNYSQKEMLIIKKYLGYGEVIIGIYNSPFQLKIAKSSISRFQDKQINILFKDQYMHLFSNLKYRNLIYVIDDVNLVKKRKLTFFKNFIQEIEAKDIKYLLLSQNNQHQAAMKRHITIYFSEIEVQQIFKFQTKSGIIEQIQQKSRQLWNSHFFTNKQEYVQFLIKTTSKLPAQLYRKYYARYLVHNKLSLAENSLSIIQKTEQYLTKQIQFNSTGLYLETQGSQQYHDLQITTKFEKCLTNQGMLAQIIAKEYYSKLLPYTFTDKIIVIVEEVFLFPLIFANLSQRKIFRLKNNLLIQQLAQIVEVMYYQDKQFYVIIEEPLSSSQLWLQWYRLYLHRLDIVNYYERFTQFTDQLASKEEFVHRKSNLNVDIKDKIQDLLHKKMKFIISIDEENAKFYNNSYVQRQRAVFFNCRLQKDTKSKIIDSITQNIINNQKQNIKNLILPYKRLFIDLIELDLISIKKLEHFLLTVVEHTELQLLDQQQRKQENKQRQNLVQNVNKIKQYLIEKVTEEDNKVNKAKNILDEVMNSIVAYEIMEIPKEMQHIYFQHLSKIRKNFFNLQEKNVIDIKQQQNQELFHQLKDIFLHECVNIYNDYVLLRVTTQCLMQVINQKDLSKKLLKTFQKYNQTEMQEFILFRYFKYILNIVEEYQKLQFNKTFLQKEVSQINYFYLLDLSIELKNKYEVIISQSQTISGKLKLIDNFKQALTNIFHIGFSHDEKFSYILFKRLTKIIRNYAVEQIQYPLYNLLKRHKEPFKQIECKMDEQILNDFQDEYGIFNREIFKQNKTIIIYDPYWRMEKLCQQMKIKVIYISSESDMHRVYGYQFQMTVFCLRLTSVKSWKENKMLIDDCLGIIQHKHSDLKQNIIEKLVLSVNNKAILQQVNTRFPQINLDFTLLNFHNLLKCSLRNKEHRFEEIKQSHNQVRNKLIKQIDLMKKLDSSQVFLYIMTLELLLQEYRQKNGQILSILNTGFQNVQNQQKIEYIYKKIIDFSKSGQIPINYTLRLIKRINSKQLLKNLSSIEGQKEKEEYLVKMLHLSRFDTISKEVEQCLQVSRFIVVFFQNFNKKIVKDLIKLQQTGRYQVRTIIEINQDQIDQFLNSKSTFDFKDEITPKEIVFFFVKPKEISKLGQLIDKCSVIWT